MKIIVTVSLLLLISGLSFGISNEVYAQNDPSILLKIVKHTQEQIENQIPHDSSDKIKNLLNIGNSHINSLDESLQNNDIESAKGHFLSAMKTFKEISKNLSPTDTSSQISSPSQESKKISANLTRLHVHVENLKLITGNHDVSFDYSEIDNLFIQAKQYLMDNQIPETLDTIDKIKSIITDVKFTLHEHALKQESHRAKEYAQKYLERTDRLIEQAKQQQIPSEIIEKLENSREILSVTESPEEIINEIRNIVFIKEKFDLLKNDRYESKILKIEKIIYFMSQNNQISDDKFAELQKQLEDIKYNLAQGELSTVGNLLKEITSNLEEIKNSTS